MGSPTALAPLVQKEDQAQHLAASMHRSRICAPAAGLCVPLFPTSAVTGASLQLLHTFFNALPPTSSSSGGGGGGSGARQVPAAANDGMQGWCPQAFVRAAPDEVGGSHRDAAPGGTQQQAVAAHFQIDGSFEVADVGTGKHSSMVLVSTSAIRLTEGAPLP